MKLTLASVRRIVARIGFHNWVFCVEALGDGCYLQVKFDEVCTETSAVAKKHGCKWYVSFHATTSEIVQTALKAVLTVLEHEAREEFTYRGKQIFGQHLDVIALLEIADRKQVRS